MYEMYTSLLWKTPVGTKERGERKDGGMLRGSMMTARQEVTHRYTHTHTDTHLHLKAYKRDADIVAEERVLATDSVKIPLSLTLNLSRQRSNTSHTLELEILCYIHVLHELYKCE